MAGKSVFEFKADLNKFAKQIGVDVALVRKQVAYDFMDKVVTRTPVDTGRARASWNMADGAPDSTVAPEGQRDPQAAADEALAKRLRVSFSQPYGVTWVSNALPYIQALEYGHSRQAAAGMVRVSLSEIEAGILSHKGKP